MLTTRTPSRRALVRGAAWATPAVAMAAGAPAYAASLCANDPCPNLSFGDVSGAGSTGEGTAALPGNSTRTSGGWAWQLSNGGWSNRSSSNPVGFRAPITDAPDDPINGHGSWFAATAEPSQRNQVITLTQTGQPALTAGCPYTIKFGAVTYTSDNSTAVRVEVRVGSTVVGTFTTATYPSAGYTDRGIQSFAVTPTTAGVVSFRILFGAVGDHEDVKIYSPSIDCT